MLARTSFPVRRLATLALILLLGPATEVRASIVLYDNTSQTSGGTTDVTGSTYIASAFNTDSSAYTLNSISLLGYVGTSSDKAEVDIYTDGGLEPGSLVATLTSPATYTLGGTNSTPALNTFNASGTVNLAANSTYFAVLKVSSGDFFLSFTDSDTGSGVGFTESSDSSSDAGTTWFNYQSEPNQLLVTATASPSVASVPEPGSLVLLGLGLLGVVGLRVRRRHVA